MSNVASEAAALERWLFDAALPLWWQEGADRVRGGFHEAIGLDGRPLARPHRARVIARQAFSYCEAGRLGWHGPWREAQRHALDYFRKHFVSADATVVSVVDLDGKVGDPRFDLYNQAFALLAHASGHRTFGEAAGWRREAVALRTTLEQSYAHPLRGFVEDRAGRLPQRSNPHMHLLEAALAWIAVDNDPAWRRMADGIAALCLERFIDPATGALRELFAADWSPAPGVDGRICEPGHHYEWAFLLDRWARRTGRNRPEAVSRLVAFADSRGLDARRGVVVNAVLTDGGIHDPTARLWAQAERIRAYLAQRRSDDEITAAIEGLRRFLATPTQGVWFDQLAPDDIFVLEPARATSLYHIIGAVAELAHAFPAARHGSLGHIPFRLNRRLPSWPGRGTPPTLSAGTPLSRPSTSSFENTKDVGARDKRGHDGRAGGSIRSDDALVANNSRASARRVIYLVTEDWYFISHRLPMARAARNAGFEVHVATRIDRHGAAIEAEGFHLHPISWRRGSLDPRDLVRAVREVRKLYRSLEPDLAHHVALPATVVGSLAAIGLPIVCLNAMTGLGTMFIDDTAKVRLARAVLRLALRPLLNRSRAAVLVQNLDDRAVIEHLGVDRDRIALIPGSGVDIDAMMPSPEPADPVTLAFVGRLVASKGIRTLLAAHERLGQRGRDIRLLIAGLPDPANPTSIPPPEIEAWTRRPNVEHLGFVEDIGALWASAHIAVLPSRREGLPLSLLEAAACGRPLVATDVPGCRDIARPGVNAFLVPLDDTEALTEAIDRLALDPQLRRKFGEAGRELVERKFSSQRIGRDLLELYRRLLEQPT